VIGDILQPTHLLFILVIALLVLGPKRLPEVGRSLGRGLRDFKDAVSSDDKDPRDELVTASSVPAAAAVPTPAVPTTTQVPTPPPSAPLTRYVAEAVPAPPSTQPASATTEPTHEPVESAGA
jgi:sec-independent protein translocase protein TatA